MSSGQLVEARLYPQFKLQEMVSNPVEQILGMAYHADPIRHWGDHLEISLNKCRPKSKHKTCLKW